MSNVSMEPYCYEVVKAMCDTEFSRTKVKDAILNEPLYTADQLAQARQQGAEDQTDKTLEAVRVASERIAELEGDLGRTMERYQELINDRNKRIAELEAEYQLLLKNVEDYGNKISELQQELQTTADALGESHTENKMLRRADEDRQKCMVKMQGDIVKYEDDIANLRTVMMAAAVEITEHWDAHCDDEGYGPANLVRRLENGYPAQYGYDADTVVRQDKRIAELEKSNAVLLEALRKVRNNAGTPEAVYNIAKEALAIAEVKP